MEHCNTILFDLDGTLTDSKIGITKCAQYALSKFGIIEEDLNKLVSFIGPPLMDSFMELYSFTMEEAKQAVVFYRERFTEKGIFENALYPGVEDMLKSLKERGLKLIIATSKPTVYTQIILDHFNISNYFDFIVGSELDGTRTRKDEVIRYAVSLLDRTNKENMVMVGDRKHDILGAKVNGIKSIGVAYGFGSEEELTAAGATYIVRTVDELKNLLLDDCKQA